MRTDWEYQTESGWQFNHAEDGASDAEHPTPRFPSQKWWASKTWRKRIVTP